MNTAAQPKYSISAKYLGPVFSLEGELSKFAQNFIFARNGTGKSFLSRAFRYLDMHRQGGDVSKAAFYLVSDESKDGKGSFSISRGIDSIGSIALEKTSENVSFNNPDTIFHVFSEDFVQDELGERNYVINGEIENEIIVDRDIIKIKNAQEELEKKKGEERTTSTDLYNKFISERNQKLKSKAKVNSQLREYKDLKFDKIPDSYSDKPERHEESFAEILNDLYSLKSIPTDPIYPDVVSFISIEDIDLVMFRNLLRKVTSPSSVSENIRKKIDTNHSFYFEGTQIILKEQQRECPFCEQDISYPGPKEIIDAYIQYFADEEENHKKKLRRFYKKLIEKADELTQIEKKILRQKSNYDNLKRFIPSKKDTELDSSEDVISRALEAINSLKKSLEEKAKALATVSTMSTDIFLNCINLVNEVIEQNNRKVTELSKAVEKADDERKMLQRNACKVFEREFTINNWSDIKNLKQLRYKVLEKKKELNELEKSGPSTKARDRVADTFELLLKEFFHDKYLFDRTSFVLKRGNEEMVRGPHRTLSDGEKTAISFCYFIASVHRKMRANSDYRKLFIVFDDPVTSMSYDYVYSIVQTLKNLNISDQGEVSINPGTIDGNKSPRPNLLVLTHSSYFFNISLTNKVVRPEASFSLHRGGEKHNLTNLRKYIAPFEQQLRHVYQVAKGNVDPDHGTGNAIRSVLEAIGRFCRPDKSDSFTDFITFLVDEENQSIRSVLINSLSHGTYYDEAPMPDDLKLACNETLSVVNRYAVGHIEIIESMVDK